MTSTEASALKGLEVIDKNLFPCGENEWSFYLQNQTHALYSCSTGATFSYNCVK